MRVCVCVLGEGGGAPGHWRNRKRLVFVQQGFFISGPRLPFVLASRLPGDVTSLSTAAGLFWLFFLLCDSEAANVRR